MSRGARLVVLVLVAIGAGASATLAVALESTVPSPYWVGADQGAANPVGGLYVLGDSISEGVPYVQTGAAVGVSVKVRAYSGWTVRSHEEVKWPATGTTSVVDAMGSGARAVFVQLGTNDIYCLRSPAWGCPAVPSAPGKYTKWATAEKSLISSYVKRLAGELTGAGKCVVWGGPRERNMGGYSVADAQWFNALLRSLQAPGRFTYLPLTTHMDQEPLKSDLASGDGMHPTTAAGRQQIADLALSSARSSCGVGA